TSGFGTPVAIAGAIMVGLGFKPFQAAVLNLIANTAPVAFGAIGTPIVTLAAVTQLDELFVKMEGGTWKEALEVWPAALMSGGSFAFMQWYASGNAGLHLTTDVVS